MPTTQINSLPSPDDNSPNDPPIHFSALNAQLDTRLVPRFTNAAARDAAITAPVEGQVCYVAATTVPAVPGRLMLYKAGAWRLVGPSPIATIAGAWSEAAGQFSTTPTVITSVAVPDPGFPYVIQVVAAGEIGSVATGTRWDLRLNVVGSTNHLHDSSIAPTELTGYQRLVTGISAVTLTGACTVQLQAVRAYGTANGNVTAFNRRFTVSVHAAAS